MKKRKKKNLVRKKQAAKKRPSLKKKKQVTKTKPERKKRVKPLPKTVLKKYKTMLLHEKAKMLKEFLHLKNGALKQSLKDASGDLSGYSFHQADVASDVYETDFMLRLAGDERERLYAIDDALKRVDEGVYGHCIACLKKIGKARLKAVPQAEHCIACQQKNEVRR